MIDRFQTIVWNAAVRFAGLMRRAGLWGPVCRPLISLGQRLFPPPTSPGQARLDGGAELTVAALSRSDTTPHVLVDHLISLGFTRACFIELGHAMSLGADPLPSPVTHSEAMYNVLCDHDIRNI